MQAKILVWQQWYWHAIIIQRGWYINSWLLKIMLKVKIIFILKQEVAAVLFYPQVSELCQQLFLQHLNCFLDLILG
jgi:hypothetical protein